LDKLVDELIACGIENLLKMHTSISKVLGNSDN